MMNENVVENVDYESNIETHTELKIKKLKKKKSKVHASSEDAPGTNTCTSTSTDTSTVTGISTVTSTSTGTNTPVQKPKNSILTQAYLISNTNELTENESSNEPTNYEEIDTNEELALLQYPKNHGTIWSDEDIEFIMSTLQTQSYDPCVMSSSQGETNNTTIINNIATHTNRTPYAVREQIKKLIFKDFTNGMSNKAIGDKFNISEQGIKLMIKKYIGANGNKFIQTMEYENRILKLQVENLKLKKELTELSKDS